MKSLLLILALLAVGSAVAYDLAMTSEERAVCEQQGGCMLITRQWLTERLREVAEGAAAKGLAAGEARARAAACSSGSRT